MQQDISHYIESQLLPAGASIELQPADDLLGIGMLSSMQFMRLIQHIEVANNLVVPPEDMVLENFQTVDAICEYLSRRLDGAA